MNIGIPGVSSLVYVLYIPDPPPPGIIKKQMKIKKIVIKTKKG
jgi:hypothetical protein